jgi:hypothetical protein
VTGKKPSSITKFELKITKISTTYDSPGKNGTFGNTLLGPQDEGNPFKVMSV